MHLSRQLLTFAGDKNSHSDRQGVKSEGEDDDDSMGDGDVNVTTNSSVNGKAFLLTESPNVYGTQRT